MREVTKILSRKLPKATDIHKKVPAVISDCRKQVCFSILVGVTRLELATSRPPDAYSNQLSYTPRCFEKRCKGIHFLNTVQIF